MTDEMGYLPLDRNVTNLFFQLESLVTKGSIIHTGNKSYLDWGMLFPDEGIVAAILDQLFHYSKTVKITGQSYRLAMKKKVGLFENK
ncbi:MAG: ATP-binding protein [Calditrichaceae bacterium]